MEIVGYFSSQMYVMTHHLNWLIQAVQFRSHNICFDANFTKVIIYKCFLLSRLGLQKPLFFQCTWKYTLQCFTTKHAIRELLLFSNFFESLSIMKLLVDG